MHACSQIKCKVVEASLAASRPSTKIPFSKFDMRKFAASASRAAPKSASASSAPAVVAFIMMTSVLVSDLIRPADAIWRVCNKVCLESKHEGQWDRTVCETSWPAQQPAARSLMLSVCFQKLRTLILLLTKQNETSCCLPRAPVAARRLPVFLEVLVARDAGVISRLLLPREPLLQRRGKDASALFGSAGFDARA